MNRWRRTLAKRRKKQRKAPSGHRLIFKGTTAAIGGIWKPGVGSRNPPPPLEEQGLPTVVTVLKDCVMSPNVAADWEDLMEDLMEDL